MSLRDIVTLNNGAPTENNKVHPHEVLCEPKVFTSEPRRSRTRGENLQDGANAPEKCFWKESILWGLRNKGHFPNPLANHRQRLYEKKKKDEWETNMEQTWFLPNEGSMVFAQRIANRSLWTHINRRIKEVGRK